MLSEIVDITAELSDRFLQFSSLIRQDFAGECSPPWDHSAEHRQGSSISLSLVLLSIIFFRPDQMAYNPVTTGSRYFISGWVLVT